MGATAVVLLLCSLVALGSACCTPDQWEGEESSIGGYARFFHHGLLKEFLSVHYDAVNYRTAAFLSYRNGEHSNSYKIVTRYDNNTNAGKLYVLDLKRDKCWIKTLKRPFRRACIPDDAKSVGSYFLGLSGGFNVTGYKIRGRHVDAFVSVELYGDECVPVAEYVYGRVRNVDFVQTIGFINISRGIRNETVFDVPKKCHDEEDTSMAEELTREHYILAI